MLQVPNLVKSDLVFNERLTEFSVDIYMNITMHRNVIKMFRIVIRIIISFGNCIKIDKNERINLMIDCNTYYVVVLLIIIVYLTYTCVETKLITIK